MSNYITFVSKRQLWQCDVNYYVGSHSVVMAIKRQEKQEASGQNQSDINVSEIYGKDNVGDIIISVIFFF